MIRQLSSKRPGHPVPLHRRWGQAAGDSASRTEQCAAVAIPARSRLPETLAACDLAHQPDPGQKNPGTLQALRDLGQRPRIGVGAGPNCDLAELVKREQLGIVVAPGDSQLLAEQLQHLSRRPDEVEAMGKRAQRVYGERFGFERSLTHYNQLLLGLQ